MLGQNCIVEGPVLQIRRCVDIHTVELAVHCMLTVPIICVSYLQDVAAVRLNGIASRVEPICSIRDGGTCCLCPLRWASQYHKREYEYKNPDLVLFPHLHTPP
ncbi:hypothetical protein D1872_299310 [compost metagenome]